MGMAKPTITHGGTHLRSTTHTAQLWRAPGRMQGQSKRGERTVGDITWACLDGAETRLTQHEGHHISGVITIDNQPASVRLGRHWLRLPK